MKAVKEKAYAKINLYLNVTAKRSDGFHEVKTVMHAISLCDSVTVEVTADGYAEIALVINGDPSLPTDDRNLAVRAARAYLDRTGITDSIRITLEKRIPVAAGLAGGSSDAAATLRALNRLYGGLSCDSLLEISAELGCDVPYLLRGGTAFCFGRGERIEPLSPLSGLNIVVAVAEGESVSTPAAYGALDALYSDFRAPRSFDPGAKLDLLMHGITEGKLDPRGLYNVFENAIFPTCCGAERLKSKLVDLGASAALMSGSGPSVYGLFESAAAARSAEAQLTALGYSAFFARSCDESQNIL